MISKELEVHFSLDLEKYLGLQKKKQAFNLLKDRMLSRIKSECAIPTYAMSCFLLSKSLYLDLEGIIRSILVAKAWGKERD
ncbi:hypothetical protein EPI10_021511 [Gossypium australe]|uniref:Uncharacterized protein n=1 Tax=Gossypium australe TaxID=47621 RepID=A0A5B6WIQ5_9ROSI|nr:hypothetical protein EPI10_021511 [Gossypium australe]